MVGTCNFFIPFRTRQENGASPAADPINMSRRVRSCAFNTRPPLDDKLRIAFAYSPKHQIAWLRPVPRRMRESQGRKGERIERGEMEKEI